MRIAIHRFRRGDVYFKKYVINSSEHGIKGVGDLTTNAYFEDSKVRHGLLFHTEDGRLFHLKDKRLSEVEAA